jgi:hypothetical protein
LRTRSRPSHATVVASKVPAERDVGPRPWVIVAAAVALLALLTVAGRASGLALPGPNEVTLAVDTTEPPSYLYPKGITIHSNYLAARNDPSLGYSINLQNLTPPEHVRVATSIYASFCASTDITGAGNPGSPCMQLTQPPDYDVKLEVHLFKASSATEVSDANTSFLNDLPASPLVCTEDRHHCPLTATAEKDLSGSAKDYINADIIAWTTSGKRQPGDRMELEGDCYEVVNGTPTTSYQNCQPVVGNQPDPNDSDPSNGIQLAPTKGQLSVARFGSSYGSSWVTAPTSHTLNDSALDVNGLATVVHYTRVDNLAPGDVLETYGTVDISGSYFDHAANSWWVLAASPGTKRPTSGTFNRYVSATNATNCLGANGHIKSYTSGYCSTTKTPPTLPVQQVGAVKVPSCTTATPPVCPPSTMYLNYVVQATDGSYPQGTTPSATVTSGTFNATCDPQPRPIGNITQPCSFPAEPPP